MSEQTMVETGLPQAKISAVLAGKYPANEFVSGEKVELPSHKNLKFNVMGGSFYLLATNQIASQMDQNIQYDITYTIETSIYKGALNCRPKSCVKFETRK